MLINSNFTVGQYFLATSIFNSVNKKKNQKFNLALNVLIVCFIVFYTTS